jgi:uncharacterized protein (TIGR03083 family)
MTTLEARRAAIRSDVVAAQAALLAALDRVGPNDWSRPSRNEGWTVQSLLTHLSTSETGFVQRIRRQASGGGGLPADFDRDRWNAGQLRRRTESSPDQLRAELEAAHGEMLALLDELDERALDQRGILDAETGQEGSVEDVYRLVASHKRAHTADIQDALKKI